MKRTIIILAEVDAPAGVDVAPAARSLGDRVSYAQLGDGVCVGRAEATSMDFPVAALVAALQHAVKVVAGE